jgi:hypothetical protein
VERGDQGVFFLDEWDRWIVALHLNGVELMELNWPAPFFSVFMLLNATRKVVHPNQDCQKSDLSVLLHA